MILVFCLCSSPGFAQDNTEDSKAAMDQTIEAFLKKLPTLKAIHAQIDRSQFDREALLDRLDYDLQKIIDFATNELAFEAYPGLLRGPDGTLISHAGNSLDQAVFLAAMIKDAGFDARIAEGEIDQEEAGRLLSGLRDSWIPRYPFLQGGEAERLIAQLNPSSTNSEHSKEQMADEPKNDFVKVGQITGSVIQKIKASGAQLGSDSISWADLVTQCRHYFWVQFKDEASGEWVNSHPAFGSRAAPVVSAQKYHADQVPDDLLHKLRVSAYISQRVGDQINDKPVMSSWEAPVANLLGVTISYQNFPSGFNQAKENKKSYDEVVAQMTAALDASRFFIPLLNHQPAPGGLAFDLLGISAPLDAASSSMAGVFQEDAKLLAKATSSLSSGGDVKADNIALIENWLKFELIDPSGNSRVIKRFLLTPGINEEDRLWALTREVTIAVEPGHASFAKYLDDTLTLIEAAGRMLELNHDPQLSASPEELKQLQRTLDSLSSSAVNRDYFAGTSTLPAKLQTISAYRPLAAVVANYRTLLGTGQGMNVPAGFDILTDFQYVWATANDTSPNLHISPEKTVELGIAQTMLESRTQLPGSRAGANAFRDWNADDKVQPVVIIDKSDLSKWPQSNSTATRNLLRDIEHGNLMILQQENLSNSGPATWWRVQPGSAETLGITASGWGGLSVLSLLQDASMEYRMFLWQAEHMVGPAKAKGAIAKCLGYLGVLSIGSHLAYMGEVVSAAPNDTVSAVGSGLQGLGLGMSAAEAAIWRNPGAFEYFMKRCIVREIWR